MYTRYLILFGTLLIGGETFMIPAIYTSLIGHLSIVAVVIIALLATLISDSIWYLIGTKIPLKKLHALPYIQKQTNTIDNAKQFFDRYGIRWLFFSKFVYGTRTATQILMGLQKIAYHRYIAINTLGVIVWIGVVYGIGWFTRESLEQLEVAIKHFQIAFGATFLIIIILTLWFMNKKTKKWLA